jgi:hypothetical protein
MTLGIVVWPLAVISELGIPYLDGDSLPVRIPRGRDADHCRAGRATNLFTALDGSGIHQGTLTGPTAAQRQQLEAVQKDAQALRSEIDRALGADLAALNDEIARAKIPRIRRPGRCCS